MLQGCAKVNFASLIHIQPVKVRTAISKVGESAGTWMMIMSSSWRSVLAADTPTHVTNIITKDFSAFCWPIVTAWVWFWENKTLKLKRLNQFQPFIMYFMNNTCACTLLVARQPHWDTNTAQFVHLEKSPEFLCFLLCRKLILHECVFSRNTA